MRIHMLGRAALVAVFLLAGWLQAGGRIRTIVYRGGGQGKVVFDHQMHAAQGLRCNDCHTDFAGTGKALFATREQGLIAFADHSAGVKCFACHNASGVQDERKTAGADGKRAFYGCDRCHCKTGNF